MDIDHYTLGIFVAVSGTLILIRFLRPVFQALSLLIALPFMNHLQRIFGLRSNASAAVKFFENFRVGGHRGAPRVAPENTIESFEKAKSSGVDLVEFDLTLTKNGIPVVIHDDDLMRTCGEPGLVSSLTLEELGAKNAGKTFQPLKKSVEKPSQHRPFSMQVDWFYSCASDNETCSKFYHIPTLESTVKYCQDNDLKMLFDVKNSSFEMVSQIASVISANNLYNNVIVSSFFPWVSYAIKKADPQILTGVTWRPYLIAYKDLDCEIPRFSGLKHFVALLLDHVNRKLMDGFLPKFLGVEMLLIYEKEISNGLVKRMKDLNIQVVAWTVNDPLQMLYLVNSLKVPILTDLPHVYNDLKAVQMEIRSKIETKN
ncbi:unnamed protein product [Thelazia callipaeda]|uniref:GP-PDE domain-containing protein n=1 Tax=Thelazia callipaeda TaxID=103827 RepID=A0A0N5CR30_THECL|nr:unnamed protein product [Thelazia callipaeda]